MQVRRCARGLAAALLAAGVVAVVANAPVAGAATFQVTNTNDAGPGSFRQAVLDASLSNADAKIELSDDLDDETIHLTTGEVTFTPASGQAALEIDGNGVTVQQDTPASRVFQHQSFGHLTLRDITIRGGRATAASGIASFGPTLIVDSTITDNVATAGDGGGIFVEGELLTVERSTFSDNHARNSGDESAGGAIAVSSSPGTKAISIEDTTITGNSATGTSVQDIVAGGGLATGGDIEIERSTIADNHVEGSTAGPIGGGGSLALGRTTATNSTITDNDAEGHGAAGGGLFVAKIDPLPDHDLEVVYTDAVGNAAPHGANLAAKSFPSLGTTSSAAAAEAFSLEDVSIMAGAAAVSATADVEAQQSDGLKTRFASFASVITDPEGGPNCAGFESTDSDGWNFADDDSCDLDGPSDDQHDGNDPLLGELADNGGPTETLLPAVDSPLVNAIPAEECHTGQDDLKTDQRGEPRPSLDDPRCDIGAVEISVPATPVVIEPTFTG